jgi:hypothetical protein
VRNTCSRLLDTSESIKRGGGVVESRSLQSIVCSAGGDYTNILNSAGYTENNGMGLGVSWK